METINNTPARKDNRNVDYIAKATKKLTELFAYVNKAKEENKTYGYAGIPYILDKMMEVGIDKIFFVGRDYHGRYEDDDCYFTYWNEAEKKFEHDEWSTRFAAPSYDLYEMPIAFSLAWEEGMIDKEAYLEHMKSLNLDILTNLHFNKDIAENYCLRVKIDGGRKWKGEGYLISISESSYRFATPMFRNHNDDFGVSTSRTAVIWDPMTNTINRANAQYLKFIDAEDIMEKYTYWAKSVIMNATIENIHPASNFGRCVLDIDYSFEKFMSDVWAKEHNIPSEYYANAYDAEAEEKRRKLSELSTEKMPGIIEWVKNNTDKTGDEVMKLAVHIFNKNYNK